jgi:hypothetical protein
MQKKQINMRSKAPSGEGLFKFAACARAVQNRTVQNIATNSNSGQKMKNTDPMVHRHKRSKMHISMRKHQYRIYREKKSD